MPNINHKKKKKPWWNASLFRGKCNASNDCKSLSINEVSETKHHWWSEIWIKSTEINRVELSKHALCNIHK